MTSQQIRQQFYAYRNGVVADQLRSAGNPCKVIFGLMVPQIAAIARECGEDDALACELWADGDCREARLLACYLFSKSATDRERALELMRQIRTPEEGDMLAFRLLKHLPFAAALAEEMSAAEEPLQAYAGRALSRHLE